MNQLHAAQRNTMIAIVASVLVSACDGAAANTSRADIIVGGSVTLLSEPIGCKEKSALERLIQLGDDRTAQRRYFSDPTNGCAMLRAGTVHVDDRAVLSSAVLVREPGDPTSYWVNEGEIARP